MIKSEATNGRIMWRQMLKYDKKQGRYDPGMKDWPMQIVRQLQKKQAEKKIQADMEIIRTGIRYAPRVIDHN